MEVAVVVRRPLALVDEHSERHVEGLFAGPADPEVAVPLLLHPDHPLLEQTRLQHVIVHRDEQIGC